MPPWTNIWLLMAMALSFGLHFVLLYVETLSTVFSVCPLNTDEWWTVLKLAMPVVLLDETLKLIARKFIDGNKRQIELLYLITAWAAFFILVSLI